jgi:hypothetical protein
MLLDKSCDKTDGFDGCEKKGNVSGLDMCVWEGVRRKPFGSLARSWTRSFWAKAFEKRWRKKTGGAW